MAKAKSPKDEKVTNVDFDIFKALEAIDNKNYGYYDTLTQEQKRKFSPYMMILWTSTVTSPKFQKEYISKTNIIANRYLFNDTISKHPKLQWMMLCASSPGKGKQFHQWLPHIRDKISKLKEDVKAEEIKQYYAKIYPNVDEELINEISSMYNKVHKRKRYLADQFPHLKLDEIDLLNELVTDDDIKIYKKENGDD